MNVQQATAIIQWINEAYPNDTFDIHPDYSGRRMYGATTTAIRFDESIGVATACMWIGRAIQSLADQGDDELDQTFELAIDQLGLGHVVY